MEEDAVDATWTTPDVLAWETTEPTAKEVMGSGVWKRSWMQNVCYWYNYAMYIVVVGVLCVFGLVGNTLIRLALWQKLRKSATVFLLICLSVVDDSVLVIYGLMLIGFKLSHADSVRETQFPKYYTRAWTMGWAVASTVQVAETWLLVLVSIYRYIAICKPTLAKKVDNTKWAQCSVLAVACSSLTFNLPRFFKYELVTDPQSGREVNVLTAFANTESFRVTYELIAYYMLVYLLPLSFLLYTSTKLVMALRHSKEKRRIMISNVQQSNTSRQQDELTRTVVAVIVVFCICQLANPIRRILEEALPSSGQGCGTFYSFYSPLSGVLVILNSAINICVWCASASGFRKQLRLKVAPQTHVHPQSGTRSTGQSNIA